MKRVFALFVVIVLSGQFAFAQQTVSNDSTDFLKPRALAFYYVRHLSAGALLVSLQERAKGIAMLQNTGDYISANKIIKQQRIQNKIIMKGFKKYFNYCPVYFFYNTYSDSILKGHMSGIFLDTNLVIDPSIKLNESFFLVAEEGNTEISDQVIRGDSTDLHPAATYTMRSGGILVMDDRFNLLKPPFPYFTEYSTFKKFGKAVNKLNQRLIDIYPYKQK